MANGIAETPVRRVCYTIPEAAVVLKMHPETLRQIVRAGEFTDHRDLTSKRPGRIKLLCDEVHCRAEKGPAGLRELRLREGRLNGKRKGRKS